MALWRGKHYCPCRDNTNSTPPGRSKYDSTFRGVHARTGALLPASATWNCESICLCIYTAHSGFQWPVLDEMSIQFVGFTVWSCGCNVCPFSTRPRWLRFAKGQGDVHFRASFAILRRTGWYRGTFLEAQSLELDMAPKRPSPDGGGYPVEEFPQEAVPLILIP